MAMGQRSVQTIQDLFLYDLAEIYDAEQRMSKGLSSMANEVNDPQVKSAIQQHEGETRQHVKNLEQCFQILGVSPQSVTCYVIQGFQQEHDQFVQLSPPPVILTAFDCGSAYKVENYEIASYRGLIEKAGLMGQSECQRLFQENLKQEEDMAQKAERAGRMIAQQQIQSSGGQQRRVV
jgi:ferritin-like metal-binding protein YciE